MNIRTKLTILCLFLVVFSSGIIYFFADRQAEKAIRSEILSNLNTYSRQAINNIDRFIASRLDEIRIAASDDFFKTDNRTAVALNERLSQLEQLSETFYSFSFFNMDRLRLGDSQSMSLDQVHSNDLYWSKISVGNPLVMDISISESLKEPVMHCASLVTDNSGNPKGVLVGRVRLDRLYDIIGDVRLHSDSTKIVEVDLINKSGVLLYSNLEKEGLLTNKYRYYKEIGPLLAPGVNFQEIEDRLFFVTSQSGYLNYAGNDWSLVLNIAKDLAYAPAYEIRSRLMWIMIAVVVMAILISLIAANIFVKPIIKLSQAAEEIGNGNLDVNIDINSGDEIGKLASQLDNTAQVLNRRFEEQRKLNQRLQDQKGEIEIQKKEIEEVHKQIQDSINYARRIQRSMLPELNDLNKFFADRLILYKPKDVVSGDFYWFERVRTGRKEHFIIVVADCTGHGVPGAIMSMMAANQLTNIVYYQNYVEPEKILARLDKAIKFELYRDMELNIPRHDGLEAGVCVIDMDTNNMNFAGAGIPLYLVRDGELEIFKSPKHTIGRMEGTEKSVEEQFTPINIQLESGDRLYLASDGFQDQFGGPSDKRYMVRNFRNTLVESGEGASMSEQQEKLDILFKDWIQTGEQTDDVVVLGIESR